MKSRFQGFFYFLNRRLKMKKDKRKDSGNFNFPKSFINGLR